MGELLASSSILAIPVALIILMVWMVKRSKRNKALLNEGVPLLPARATVRKAYKLAWRYKMEYLKISWCWLVLAVLAIFLVNFLFESPICIDGKPIPITTYQPSFKDYILPELQQIIELFFGVSIAVAWHRLILRNERVMTNIYLRFDKVVWNYFIIGLLILFITDLPGIIMFIGGVEVQPSGALAVKSVLALIFSIIAYFYAMRLSVFLPAKALDIEGITIKEVLHRTRRNNWKLCWGSILCGLILIPTLLIIGIPAMTMSAELSDICSQSSYTLVMNTITPVLMLLIEAPIYLSFLSLAYQFFFEKGEESTAD